MSVSATKRSTSSTSLHASFPVKEAITKKLTESLSPTHLEVRNESYMHNVPPNSETHFKVIVVSPAFASTKTPLARHRMVNSVLSEEVASNGPVHALSIVASTPEQWDAMAAAGKSIGPSPSCRGGDGSLPDKRS
eukprot:CAMPEP_0113554336 /NCGR_PEP_ID=MMETSP0015_2-20120614/16093_1 /TAXON_ID=2838 /ORGANISM="Odontella" /LENGTH=134 /DNA_ID=CAMNT_0000455467 /DNA_START=96 /DNA_END=500 /DNA_ORIENTATION=+ /assembly_acc=CAM_ASM_000160